MMFFGEVWKAKIGGISNVVISTIVKTCPVGKPNQYIETLTRKVNINMIAVS